jgi:hypothetical protein
MGTPARDLRSLGEGERMSHWIFIGLWCPLLIALYVKSGLEGPDWEGYW